MNSEHLTFAVEIFFKTVESVIATQRAFHTNFMLYHYDAVLDEIFNP